MSALTKPGLKLVVLATAVTCIVVVLGAFTRLVDAGLGCPDWPGCYGQLLWPDTAAEIALAESKFPDAPVETDKTWPEMVHRYFASSLGLLIIAICWVSVRAASAQSSSVTGRQPIKLPIFLLGLVILQGMFGMWTVTLKLWPQVVTAHLLGGMATLSCLWLLTQRLAGSSWRFASSASEAVGKLKHLSFAVLLLVIVQIALGGWTSSNYAALACMDLPMCQGQWLPPANFGEAFDFTQKVGPNYLGGLLNNEARTAIHLSHRMGAVVVSLSILFLSWRLFAVGEPKTRRMAMVLVSILLLQVLLGLSNIYWALPLPIAVAHNGVGALLLLSMVTLNHRVFTLQK
jgi:cytochrome c oxidase assembly protein subunit 15